MSKNHKGPTPGRANQKAEYFIAERIHSGGISGKRFAGPVIKVATAGIVLGVTVMLPSLAIGNGFKKEIREKVSGFSSHIQVVNYDFNQSFESNPITHDSLLVGRLRAISGIQNVQRFITKPGLLKTNNEIQGLVLKGIGKDYQTDFLENILTAGQLPRTDSTASSNDLLLSEALAQLLQLQVGDEVFMYFFQEQIRIRRFTVCGLFNSHLPDFDKSFAITDLRILQRLNGWETDEIAGYELVLQDFAQLDPLGQAVYEETADVLSASGNLLRTQTIRQTHPPIFGWLDLLDMNIAVIILLIVLVAGFNMISGLLILILERTNMIGLLKSLGMADWPLRRIFIYLATRIALKGLLWGNALGLGLAMLQKHLGWARLDPANYFLDTVPIALPLHHILLLNIGALAAIFLMMIGPSYLAARISPVKALRLE